MTPTRAYGPMSGPVALGQISRLETPIARRQARPSPAAGHGPAPGPASYPRCAKAAVKSARALGFCPYVRTPAA